MIAWSQPFRTPFVLIIYGPHIIQFLVFVTAIEDGNIFEAQFLLSENDHILRTGHFVYSYKTGEIFVSDQ